MKNILYIMVLLLASTIGFSSCGNSDDALDSRSIFDTTTVKRNDFDKWILKNFTEPYNVELIYRMEDIQSDYNYTLVPAELSKSIALAKLIKYLWFESYDEVAGVNFTRSYVPRIIHLIGSAAWNDNNTFVLGTAEGGLMVTLYMVNDLDLENISVNMLNTYYFHTMHHEFTHILTQHKNYDSSFQNISENDYVSGNWYQYSTSEANQAGFVTSYAMDQYNEDFAETLSTYVTSTDAQWQAILSNAGSSGSEIILEKLDMIKNYMKNSWGIDLDKLRSVIQRRSSEIGKLDLENL